MVSRLYEVRSGMGYSVSVTATDDRLLSVDVWYSHPEARGPEVCETVETWDIADATPRRYFLAVRERLLETIGRLYARELAERMDGRGARADDSERVRELLEHVARRLGRVIRELYEMAGHTREDWARATGWSASAADLLASIISEDALIIEEMER